MHGLGATPKKLLLLSSDRVITPSEENHFLPDRKITLSDNKKLAGEYESILARYFLPLPRTILPGTILDWRILPGTIARSFVFNET